MTLRVFVVDDEPPARARLRQLLGESDDVVIVGEAVDAVDARDAIVSAQPDVVFLDIEMPQMSGTMLAESLPEPRPLIVFATAFDRYALDAFAVDATDYLLKPVTRTRLAHTLSRLRERLSRRSDLERDLVAASAAQTALLPRSMPAMTGFEAAAVTRPARGVGGDFFVALELTSERYVLALGDVAGKGLPASLVAASLQARIEAVARHADGSASDVVADVNRMLCATSDPSRFATLAYIELNPLTRRLVIINAGHLPGVLVSPGAEPARFAATAPALGLLPDATFPTVHIDMPEKATLVVVSDGVTEAFDGHGEEFGEGRLLRLLNDTAFAHPGDVCDAIVTAVRQHAPGTPSDDLTVLALKRMAEAAGS